MDERGALRHDLRDRWATVWPALALPVPPVFNQLCDRYSEPHRAYHTLQHLSECLAWGARARHLALDPAAVAIALWFHDAIYDTRRTDNEEWSAAWAVQVLQGVGGGRPLQQTVQDLILATEHNAIPSTDEARLVVDCNLAILGASPGRFAQYEAQIRQEYAWVPEEVFRQRRAAVLRSFLARPSIFALAFFQGQLEQQARHNLQTSLAQLRG